MGSRWRFSVMQILSESTSYINAGPLFAWADLQQRLRREAPAIVRHVAIRGRVSHLHALAFIEANGIGPAGAR
jgi:hypothetical protein